MFGHIGALTSIRSISNTALERVSENGASTKVRDIDPELVAEVVFNKVLMHIGECHACLMLQLCMAISVSKYLTWLYQAVCAFHVYLKNLVHVFPHIDN